MQSGCPSLNMHVNTWESTTREPTSKACSASTSELLDITPHSEPDIMRLARTGDDEKKTNH
jgi:hypothetical protein